MKKRILIVGVAIGILLIFSYCQNNNLSTSTFILSSENITKPIKVVQLSDLHSKQFGKKQKRLIKKVKQLAPDIIAFTGDLVDSKKYDERKSMTLMEELVQIAPTYYVTGNHESWSGKFPQLEEKLLQTGVYVLRNEQMLVNIGGETINLIGVDDPTFLSGEDEVAAIVGSQYHEEYFNLLLSHRPELLSHYEKMDLVLTGHAHGGQVRLPFIGGVVAPDQGFMPEYTAGMYKKEETVMIVNRGLGNSIIPQRIFNRPEIVEVVLK
ncbi:metallophosphoesterase [Niallia sp.]|uniref:metallophosphoesterase n=1 Tax=Niallia sp. TaxID=2837523 RepID=UPI00289BA771|nr:metallophosphoesterase [Niallia sp.]